MRTKNENRCIKSEGVGEVGEAVKLIYNIGVESCGIAVVGWGTTLFQNTIWMSNSRFNLWYNFGVTLKTEVPAVERGDQASKSH